MSGNTDIKTILFLDNQVIVADLEEQISVHKHLQTWITNFNKPNE